MMPTSSRLTLLKSTVLVAILAFSPINNVVSDSKSWAESKQKLDEITASIKKLEQNIQHDSGELNRLQREMTDLDKQIGYMHQQMAALEQDLQQTQASQTALLTQQAELKQTLAEQDTALRRQVRLAYMSQRKGKWQSLIGSTAGGNVGGSATMYEYVHQARINEIQTLVETSQALIANQAALENKQKKISGILEQQNEQIAVLDSARIQKDKAQSLLSKNLQTAKSSLKREEEKRAKVQKLIKKLLRSSPAEVGLGFAQAKGRMPWPVEGKLLNRFGAKKPGSSDIAWEGVRTAAIRGTEIKTIHSGIVIFADYFQGFGWLIIIDHGKEYMSLYAHAEVLTKQAGDRVEQGETVALVGDSGNVNSPELYFEIRRQGTPVNPRDWCKLPKIAYSS